MFSLLIVDDERWVRQGLRTTIDWKAEGIEVLGEAEDGEEALRMIERQIPDIIITDIKMPRIDGLALIETVQTRGLVTKIIIISGSADFSYAQKALRFGVSDYVLKPIEETQILDVVRRCVDQIRSKHENHYQIKRMSESIRECLPLARQRYLEILLTKESTSPQKRNDLWDKLNIHLDPDRLKVICVKVYDWGAKANDVPRQPLLRYALGNIAEEIGTLTGKTISCPLDHHEDADLVILMSPSENDDGGIERDMNNFIEAAGHYLGIRINIGISKIRERAKLPASFQEAIHASAYAFYKGYGKVYDAARLPQISSPQLQNYKGPNGWENRFVHAMKLGKESMLDELIDELIVHTRNSSSKYVPYQMRNGLMSLLQEIEKKLEVRSSSEQYFTKRFRLPYCSLSELQDELLTVVRELQRSYSKTLNRKTCIKLALKYLDEHFTETITMNGVAERHYLNPSYFSKIFHEETGETFSKYLIRIRLEKAKNLLKHSTLKIYEIAEQVGYQDFRHFVKLFKDQEGITPAQYRDLSVQ